jgi:AP-2 complex subunit sigma-1
MIRFVLLQNRQGKTRLSKWYTPPKTANGTTTDAEKARIEAEIHRLVTARDKKYTNFSAFFGFACGRSVGLTLEQTLTP